MRRAKSNLLRAQHRIPNVYLEDLCFDAQQASEKALKAVCIHYDINFPYVHDLAKLLTLIEEEAHIPSDVRQAARLTRYAVVTRYPGLAEPVTDDEYEEAVALAERVVKWVEGII
jgi:HEPN domain-containing protein